MTRPSFADKNVAYPNRYRLEKLEAGQVVDTSTVMLTPDWGLVVNSGELTAGMLNGLTDYVDDEIAFALSTLADVLTFKGSVASYAYLPSTEQSVGDCYNCLDTGKFWAWSASWYEVTRLPSDIERYGVKFQSGANTGVTVTRTYAAQGLVANAATDAATAVNDFDSVYPWAGMVALCGDYDADGNMVVNAYMGEPGFARDGSNGNVWVYRPEFWWDWTLDSGTEEIVVSPYSVAGYHHAPARYYAAYKMSKVNDKGASVSGVFSEYGSLVSSMALARANSAKHCVGQVGEWTELAMLFAVEYATRNCQAVMAGFSSGRYSASDASTAAGTDQFITTSEIAALYRAGDVVGIGASLGSFSVANNAVITGISGGTISLDTSGVTVPSASVIFHQPYKCGVTDAVLGPSGSPSNNANGKNCCRYRYIEDPWGSAYEDICDVACKRTGAGTAEDPYVYTPWVLPDVSKWTNGSVTGDYVEMNYKLCSTDGYAKTFGIDSRYPEVRLTDAIGAGTSTWWSDYYYYPRYETTSIRRGGRLGGGGYAGLLFWDCNYPAASSNWACRARLSYRTG